MVVVDRKRGDAATKALPQALAGLVWKVAEKDYSRVAEVRFDVRAKEGPVASGVVVVQGKAASDRLMLSQSDRGSVSWRMVEPGDVKVSFEYKADGQSKTLPAQTFEIKMGLGKPTVFALDVNDKVDMVKPDEPPTRNEPSPASGPPATPPTAKAEAAGQHAAAGILANLTSMVFGLVVVGGVAYGLWWYVKNNQKQVQTVLDQVGVPVGRDPADPVGDSPPVTPSAPQPVQKIVLADAAPSSTGVVATPSASATPRLVAEDGTETLLSPGPNPVGREPGTAVAVLGEPSVSRHHATITLGPAGTEVTDMDSTNGTYVNGMKLSSPIALRPGDRIQFGAKRFRYEE